jgi:hypothetical protein
VDVAVNRGHDRVAEADVLQAERAFSEDAFQDLVLELRDVKPHYQDMLYAFIGTTMVLSRAEVERCLSGAGVQPDEIQEALDLLLWFGFLGIHQYPDEERYAYQFQHNLRKMLSGLNDYYGFVIHPSFRSALGCSNF